MEPDEAPGRHEGEREEQDARVAAAVGRLTRRVAEAERDGTHEAEDYKVQLVVLDVRIEPLAEQKRDEPDQGQRGGDEDRQCKRAGSRTLPGQLSSGRGHSGYFVPRRPIGFR